MQIFTYMDSDQDTQLKYRDFCNLCAEQVLNAPSQSSRIGSSKGGSEFSKIISSLKQKHSGRGGPNFAGKRGLSAENFSAAKTVKQVVGEQPFVSSEMQRFMMNKQDLPPGHTLNSPQHNRFDSVRDDSVYNSIGGLQQQAPPSQTQWSRSGAASSNLGSFKSRLAGQTHGLTSEQLSHAVDPHAKANGGEMAGIMNYDYERDYIIEAMMQDKVIQAKKLRKKSFDLRKTTKAAQGNLLASKKRIEAIHQNELLAQSPLKKHSAGSVPQFYPMQKVGKMLQKRDLQLNNNYMTTAHNNLGVPTSKNAAVKAIHDESY